MFIDMWTFIGLIYKMVVSLEVLILLLLIDDNFSIPIRQSEKCTERELELRIQCFRNVPLKDNFVLVNDSIIIPCLVNNQHGKVQWRAKNLVLGYDRSVPGMPRLQIVGDVTKGEHNLHLYRVQLTDSGEYECQVQPVDIHPLLRRRTLLHVTNLPSPPFITYKNQIPENNEIIIDSSQQSSSIFSLTCLSYGGVPPPLFQWTWNARSLENSVMSEIAISQPNPIKSILNIPVSFFKSGHTINCSVKNRATELAEAGNQTPMNSFSSKIKIILYTPPGLPQIEYRPKSQFIEAFEGRGLEVVCSLKPVGKPHAVLKWRLDSLNDNNFPNHQTTIFDKHDTRLLTKLVITNVTRDHHYSNLSCISQHPLTIRETAPITLLVKHIPNRLYILQVSDLTITHNVDKFDNLHDETSNDWSIEGLENEDVNLVCVTGSYFGNIQMKWLLESGEQFDESRTLSQTLSALDKRDYRLSLNFTTQTVISQTVKLKRAYNSGAILCHVITEDGNIISSRAKFNVYYLPKLSVISGYVSQFPLHEGDMIQLTCCSYGGNPIPQLRWLQNKKIVLETSGNVSNSDEQTLVFVARMFRKDNGQQLSCEARNEKIASKSVRSNRITINVVFPPSQLTLVCENCVSGRMFTNTTTNFLCETTSSNPGSFMIWRILNCSGKPNQNVSKCSSSVVEGSMATNVPGTYNGWRSQSRLNVKLSYQHHGLIIECESSLSHKMFPDRYKSLRKQMNLYILHPPVLLNFKAHSRLTVDENSNLTIPMMFSANPVATNCMWYLNKKVISTENPLRIVKIKSNQRGIYVFQVFNVLGSATTSIYVDIEYPPQITTSWVGRHGSYYSLFCSATSNPMFYDKYPSWHKLMHRDRLVNPAEFYHYISSLSMNTSCLRASSCSYGLCSLPSMYNHNQYATTCKRNMNNYSTLVELTVRSRDPTDFGWFACSFDNGKGVPVSRLIHLNIPLTPRHINVLQYSKHGSQINQLSKILCCFVSHNQPTIMWLCPPRNLTRSGNVSMVAEGVYCGQLDVYIGSKNQYGSYICQAFNDVGKSKPATVLLKPIFKPELPSFSNVFVLSNSTVVISWIQMAFGGGTQIYQVRWKRKLDNAIYQYKTITGNPSSERLSVKLSNLLSGRYLFEIGISSTFFSTIEYCCRDEFSVSQDENSSTTNPNGNVVQQSAKSPTSHGDISRSNVLFITFMSTLVGILTTIVIVFIFIYLVKYRRKPRDNSHNNSSNKAENSLYKRSEKITKLTDIPTSNENCSQDFQIEIKTNDEESPMSEEEKIKFLASLAVSDQCKYFPVRPTSTFYQMKPTSNIYSNNDDIKKLSLPQSSSPLFYQGIYGKFIMQNYQPCDCQLTLGTEGLTIVSNQ